VGVRPSSPRRRHEGAPTGPPARRPQGVRCAASRPLGSRTPAYGLCTPAGPRLAHWPQRHPYQAQHDPERLLVLRVPVTVSAAARSDSAAFRCHRARCGFPCSSSNSAARSCLPAVRSSAPSTCPCASSACTCTSSARACPSTASCGVDPRCNDRATSSRCRLGSCSVAYRSRRAAAAAHFSDPCHRPAHCTRADRRGTTAATALQASRDFDQYHAKQVIRGLIACAAADQSTHSSARSRVPPAGIEPATHGLGRLEAPPTVAVTSLFCSHGVLLCRRWRRCCAVVHPPIHSPQLYGSAGCSPVQLVLGRERREHLG
jgi:hypothetical protein